MAHTRAAQGSARSKARRVTRRHTGAEASCSGRMGRMQAHLFPLLSHLLNNELCLWGDGNCYNVRLNQLLPSRRRRPHPTGV